MRAVETSAPMSAYSIAVVPDSSTRMRFHFRRQGCSILMFSASECLISFRASTRQAPGRDCRQRPGLLVRLRAILAAPELAALDVALPLRGVPDGQAL